MAIASWAAMAAFAAAASFATESGTRYVFCLIDSGFRIKSETEIVLANTAAPDTAAVRAKAQSLATWPSGIRMNPAAMDGVWMGFEPAGDLGDIVFVSDTDPVRPLLVLRVDAMCGGCIYRYETYGDSSIPRASGPPNGDPIVSDLEEGAASSMTLTSDEKASVAIALARAGFPPADGPIRVHALKEKSVFPSTEGITYVAYYVVPAPVSALHPLRSAVARHAASAPGVDALGRRATGIRFPAESPRKAYRPARQGD
jgi:hypothetical protein